MRNLLRKALAKRKLLRGNMTDMQLRMWCIEHGHFWNGFNFHHAKEIYKFLTATEEELKEAEM